VPLFSIQKEYLKQLEEKPFKLEKEMQKLCEKNLTALFGLEFVSTEFSVGNFRIDTLAFDKAAKAFVIIEYKKVKKFSVIDQGFSYLSTMLDNKSDFILEYNENKIAGLQRKDIDWSQSRVVFISPSFTAFQRGAINFNDLPIELWEIKRYANHTISLDLIVGNKASESIKSIANGRKVIEKVSKEIVVHTEESHLEGVPDEIRGLYERFKEAILDISDSIKIKPVKRYISFSDKGNIVDICIQKKSLKIWINAKSGELDDSKKLFRNVSDIGHWGNGDYEVQISDDKYFEYILFLVKQNYILKHE